MPTIRDGRGVLTVHDMGVPPANPSGPVQRLVEPAMVRVPDETGQTNADRMAASRARGAKAGGFVAGATKSARRWNGQPPEGFPPPSRAAQTATARATLVETRNGALTSRQQQVIEALGRLGSRKAVQLELGAKHIQSIDGTLLDAHAKGLLPLDLPDLPKRLQKALAGGPPPLRRGRHAVDPAGKTAAEVRRAQKAATIEPQGREAGAPATDADDRGITGAAPATEVATPPGPTPGPFPGAQAAADATDRALGMEPEYSEPDSPPTIVHLTISIDVVRLAQEMRSWSTYQITPFFDGLAKVIHEAQS